MNWIIVIIAVLVCGQLWRMGGDGQSLWRNPGVPIVIASTKLIITGGDWWVLIYIPLLWGALQAFSYGVDAPVHNFWERVWHCGSHGNAPFVELCTRGTCGFLWSLPAILFAIITGGWILMSVYAVFLMCANALIWLIKDVEINERLVGACVALALLV